MSLEKISQLNHKFQTSPIKLAAFLVSSQPYNWKKMFIEAFCNQVQKSGYVDCKVGIKGRTNIRDEAEWREMQRM